MMKVAIVGATGVTGTSIVDALLSAKEDVFVRKYNLQVVHSIQAYIRVL